jgi:hypothetical protein
MRALLVVGLVLPIPAIAADFRGTEFDSSCALIADREKALGSQQIPANLAKGPGYRFNGRVLDKDAQIIYLCKDGVLKVGNYVFSDPKYDDAVADYIAAYGQYELAYGSPTLVYSKPGITPVFPAVGAAEPNNYHASWHLDDVVVHVDLLHHSDDTGPTWHVWVVISENTK